VSRRALTPGTAVLLMLGIGTVAVVGLPGVATPLEPAGSLGGVVVDEHGAPVEGCRVALFQADELELVEWTSTDSRGRFAFQESPAAFHAFAAPDEESGLAGAWCLARASALAGRIELTLPSASPLTVTATDEQGHPVEDAEVRVYDHRDAPVVLARVPTDAQGHAHVLAPRDAWIAVLGGSSGRLSTWSFTRDAEADELTVVLPVARTLTGRVVDGDRAPLEGVVVSAWDRRADGWHRDGYRLSNADGSFALEVATDHATLLRAADPSGAHLPALRELAAAEPAEVELALDAGDPLEVHADPRPTASPLPDDARVWIWDGPDHGWSWGAFPAPDGHLTARADTACQAALAPLAGGPPLAVAAADPAAPGPLELHTPPTEPTPLPDAPGTR